MLSTLLTPCLIAASSGRPSSRRPRRRSSCRGPGRGATLADQTPWSSFTRSSVEEPSIQSPRSLTSSALGAQMRNVTLRSGAISVETRASFGVVTRGGAGAAGAGGAEANRSTRSSRAFQGSGRAAGPPTARSRITSSFSEYAGHLGRPSPFGSPVCANATQYAFAAAARASSSGDVASPYFARTVSKTNGISVASAPPPPSCGRRRPRTRSGRHRSAGRPPRRAGRGAGPAPPSPRRS